MRSLTRPIGLLLTTFFVSLMFTNAVLAFECANAGASTTAPDDSGVAAQTACGDGAVASGSVGTAVGEGATAGGIASTALGSLATANGTNGTAVGRSASASGSNGTALGQGPVASGNFTTALGSLATASADNTTAVGYGATSSGTETTALGRSARVLTPHINATALGWRAQVEQSNAMVLGSIPGVNDPLGGTNEYVDVGIGTSMPQAPLHVERADGTARVQVTEIQPGPSMPFQGVAEGLVRFELNDEAAGERWRFTNAGDKFAINNVGGDSPGTEMSVFKNGDMVIGGLLTENSDVNSKQDIVPLDAQEVLAKIVELEVSEWSYIDAPNQRHISPMAQNFFAAFSLGRDNKHIATLDTSGVALAGIQALAEDDVAIRAQNESMLEQLATFKAQNESLLEVNAELSERLAALEQQQAETQAMMVRLLEAQQAQPVLTSSLAN